MRLLHTSTIKLTEFIGVKVPPYVILSHTWNEEEVTFSDLMSGAGKEMKGYLKLKGACALAKRDGYEWIWVDTCGIDKSSSSELQEAINSMYRWYKNADICYAYLIDVPKNTAAAQEELMRESRWFTRGWTLQELIAPPSVEFYAADWSFLGTRTSLREMISTITGINKEIFEDAVPSSFCAAQRMSWASHRQTAREEDMAYSLMGLFNVHMPLLYGEGSENAFQRLQEAIFKVKEDHSLFLWNASALKDGRLLAPSPREFCQDENCKTCQRDEEALALSYFGYSSLKVSTPFYYYHFGNVEKNSLTPQAVSFTGSGCLINLWIGSRTRPSDEDKDYDPYQTYYAVLNVYYGDDSPVAEFDSVYMEEIVGPTARVCMPLSRDIEREYVTQEYFFERVFGPFLCLELHQITKAKLRQVYINRYSTLHKPRLQQTIDIASSPFEVVNTLHAHCSSLEMSTPGRLQILPQIRRGYDAKYRVALVLHHRFRAANIQPVMLSIDFQDDEKPICGIHLGQVKPESSWADSSFSINDHSSHSQSDSTVVRASLKRVPGLTDIKGEIHPRHQIRISLQENEEEEKRDEADRHDAR